jgi:YgiT-type zinc finger domain-containing protein
VKSTKCSFCEGRLQRGKTEFVARVEDEVIVIKEVPAYVCEQCGESYYTPEISRKIDEIMREFHRGKLLVRPLAAGEIELKLEE